MTATGLNMTAKTSCRSAIEFDETALELYKATIELNSLTIELNRLTIKQNSLTVGLNISTIASCRLSKASRQVNNRIKTGGNATAGKRLRNYELKILITTHLINKI